MATTRTFSDMLNEYVSEELLINEIKKRDWFLSNVEMTTDWLGGNYIVPFIGAVGSSVSFGGLTADTDIAQEIAVRGSVTAYKEAWGSMIFNHTDIVQHGVVNEQNFLKILPDAINRHVDYFRQVVSQNLLVGKAIATIASFRATPNVAGDNTGIVNVANPERFQIGQKVTVDDTVETAVTGYIKTINMNLNGGSMLLVTARGGATPVDLSAFLTTDTAVLYGDGQQADGFVSAREILLSATNGGSATVYGVTKTDYPYTQAINVDGASVTSTNILNKIFDAYVAIRQKGQGKPFKVVMSYRNYGYCLSQLETSKGAFNVIPMSGKTKVFGWDSIQVGGFAGTLELVATVEMNNSEIYFLDTSSMKFATNKGIMRRKSPDGIEYFEKRATTGYQYIVDHCLYGEMIFLSPCNNGILYNIP